MKSKSIFTLLSLIIIQGLFAQSKNNQSYFQSKQRVIIDSLEYELLRNQLKFNSLIHLSSGELFQNKVTEEENDFYYSNYRVEIYLSEIYKSLYITKIDHFGEGGLRISSSHEVDLEKIDNVNSETTSSLKFIRRIDFDAFEVCLIDKSFIFKIISPNEVIIL